MESTASQQALARSAIGRGIRHGWTIACANKADHQVVSDETEPFSEDARSKCLSQLESNYRSSMDDLEREGAMLENTDPTPLDEMQSTRPAYGFLSQNSSLVDLAMIPGVDEVLSLNADHCSNCSLTFVDFPNDTIDARDNEDVEDVSEQPLDF
jgi:hypothetical protein